MNDPSTPKDKGIHNLVFSVETLLSPHPACSTPYRVAALSIEGLPCRQRLICSKMQGSNDVPFAGSLLRKSSHTTYGRRGRASLAVKEGQGAERRTSPQGKEVETSDLNANTRTDQSTHTQGSELDRNGAVATGVGRKSAPLAANGAATGVKRSGTREVAMVGDLGHTSGSLLTGESF